MIVHLQVAFHQQIVSGKVGKYEEVAYHGAGAMKSSNNLVYHRENKVYIYTMYCISCSLHFTWQ